MRSGGQSNIKRREVLKKYKKADTPATQPAQPSVVATPEPTQIRKAHGQTVSQSGIVVAPSFPVNKDPNKKSTDLAGDEIKMDPETGEWSLAQVKERHPVEQFIRGTFVPTEQIIQMPKDLIEGVKTQNQGMKETGLDLSIAPLLKPFAMAQDQGLTTNNWYWPSALTYDNQSLPEFMQKGQGSDDDFLTGVGRNLGIIGDVVSHEKFGDIVGQGYEHSAERFMEAPAHYIGTAVGEIPYWLIGVGQVSAAAKVSAKAAAYTVRSGGKVPNVKILKETYKAERAASGLEKASNTEMQLNKIEPEKYSRNIPMKKQVLNTIKIVKKIEGIRISEAIKKAKEIKAQIKIEKKVTGKNWQANVVKLKTKLDEQNVIVKNAMGETKKLKGIKDSFENIDKIKSQDKHWKERVNLNAKVQTYLLPSINTIRRTYTDQSLKVFGNSRAERLASFIEGAPGDIGAKAEKYLSPVGMVEGDKARIIAEAVARGKKGEFDGPLGALRFDRYMAYGSSKQTLQTTFSFLGRRRQYLKNLAGEVSEIWPYAFRIKGESIKKAEKLIDERIKATKVEMDKVRPIEGKIQTKRHKKADMDTYKKLEDEIVALEREKSSMYNKLSYQTKKTSKYSEKFIGPPIKSRWDNFEFVHDFEALSKASPEAWAKIKIGDIILAQRPSVSMHRVKGQIIGQIGDNPKTSAIAFLTKHDYTDEAVAFGKDHIQTKIGTGVGFRNIKGFKTLIPQRKAKQFEAWTFYKADDTHRAGQNVRPAVILDKNTPIENVDLIKNELGLEDFTGHNFIKKANNDAIMLQYIHITKDEILKNAMINTGKRSSKSTKDAIFQSSPMSYNAQTIINKRNLLENRHDVHWYKTTRDLKEERLYNIDRDLSILQSGSKSPSRDEVYARYKIGKEEVTLSEGGHSKTAQKTDIEDVIKELKEMKTSLEQSKLSTSSSVQSDLLHTPETITKLESNQIMVYGANKFYQNYGGAAGDAAKIAGAGIHGKSGIVNQSYGVVTKISPDRNLKSYYSNKKYNPGGHDIVKAEVQELIKTAKSRPDLEFLVTNFGTNRAGFKTSEIVDMFGSDIIQPNIVISKQFFDALPISIQKKYTTARTVKTFKHQKRLDNVVKELNVLEKAKPNSKNFKEIAHKYAISISSSKGEKSNWVENVKKVMKNLGEEKKGIKEELDLHEKNWLEQQKTEDMFKKLGLKAIGDGRGTFFSAPRDVVKAERARKISEEYKTDVLRDTKTKKEYYIHSHDEGQDIYEIIDSSFTPDMLLPDNKTPIQTTKYFSQYQGEDPLDGPSNIFLKHEDSSIMSDIPGIAEAKNFRGVKEATDKNFFPINIKIDDIRVQTSASEKYLKKLSEKEVSELNRGNQLGSYLYKSELFKKNINTTDTKFIKTIPDDIEIYKRTNLMHITANIKIRTSKRVITGFESIVDAKQNFINKFKNERLQPVKTPSWKPDDWSQQSSSINLYETGTRGSGYNSQVSRMLGAGDEVEITTPGKYPAGWSITPMYEIKSIFNITEEVNPLNSKSISSKVKNPKKDQKLDNYDTLLDASRRMKNKEQSFKEAIVYAYEKNIGKTKDPKVKEIAADPKRYQNIVTHIKKDKLIRFPKKREIATWRALRREKTTMGKKYGFINPDDLPEAFSGFIDNRSFKEKVVSHIKDKTIGFENKYFKPDQDYNKNIIGSLKSKIQSKLNITIEDMDPEMVNWIPHIIKNMPENLKRQKHNQKLYDKLEGKNLTAEEFAMTRMKHTEEVKDEFHLSSSATEQLTKKEKGKDDIIRYVDITGEDDIPSIKVLGFDDTGKKDYKARFSDKEQITGKGKKRGMPKGDEDVNFGMDSELKYGIVKTLMYKRSGYGVDELMNDKDLAVFIDIANKHKGEISSANINKTIKENPKEYSILKEYAEGQITKQKQLWSGASRQEVTAPKFIKPIFDRDTVERVFEQRGATGTKKPKSGFTSQAIGTAPVGQTLSNALDSLTAGPEASTTQFLPQAHAQENVLDEAISSVQSTLGGLDKGIRGIARGGLKTDANMTALQGLFNPTATTGVLQTPHTFTSLITSPILDTAQKVATKTEFDTPVLFAFAQKYIQAQRQDIATAEAAKTRVLPRLSDRVMPTSQRARVLPSFLALPPGFNIGDPSKRKKKKFIKKKTKKTWWQTPEWWYEPYYWGGGKDQLGAGYVTFKGAEPARVKRYEKKFFGVGVGF